VANGAGNTVLADALRDLGNDDQVMRAGAGRVFSSANCQEVEGHVRMTMRFWTMGAAVVLVLAVGLVLPPQTSRSQSQSFLPAQSIDQKLDRVLAFLERIDKRQMAASPTITAVQPVTLRGSRSLLFENGGEAPADLPFVAVKQKPHSSTFKGCGARGENAGIRISTS